MILTIDIGNTNIVFGFWLENKLVTSLRAETRQNRSADEYYVFISPFLSKLKIAEKDIKKIIVSSVVPKLEYEFTKFCKEYLHKKPVFISDIKDKLKLKIKIDKPEELGADRIVNSLAAINIYKRTPIVIIDLGTATTFDVVDKNGAYIGGIIAPGINLSFDALQKAAAKLPKIDIAKPRNIIGKNTKNAMQSGLYYGYASMIEGMINKISIELGKKPFVIATGGLSSLFEEVKIINEFDENLTLKGLKMIGDRI